jgi:hypothetical protein
MRRSVYSLAAMVAGLTILGMPTLSTVAAPKTVAPTTVHKATSMSSAAVAANIARARRLAMSKRGMAVYLVQARNPGWTRSSLTTPANAVATTLALRRQGVSAHVHNLGAAGSYVHYGQVHWANKGAATNLRVANASAATLRALGLQARVVTRIYRS